MTEPTKSPAGGDEKAAALEAYNAVVADAELSDIRLVSVDFRIRPEYYDLVRNEKVKKLKLKRTFAGEFSNFSFDPKTKMLGGQFEWSISTVSARKKPLQVTVVYFIAYKNVPDVDITHSKAFISRVGRFATYPYFRALVSQLSWESKANLPTMPVLK
jgi:hypothetical protein